MSREVSGCGVFHHVQMRAVPGEGAFMGVHQGLAVPGWSSCVCSPASGRPGPWNWKEHIHRLVSAWQLSVGCPAERQRLVSKQGL